MKYLNTYKKFNVLFEELNDELISSDWFYDKKEDIEDILLSFTDGGFEINIKKGYTTRPSRNKLPLITVEMNPKNRVNPNGLMTKEDQITVTQDMIDDLSRLKGYMNELGFDDLTSKVAYFANAKGEPITKNIKPHQRVWLTGYHIDIEPGTCEIFRYSGIIGDPSVTESILGYNITSITLSFKPSQLTKVQESMTMREFNEVIDDLLLPFSDVGFLTENRIPAGGIVIKMQRLDLNKIKFKEIKEDLSRLLEYLSNNVPSWNIEVTIQVAKQVDEGIIYPPKVKLPINGVIDLIDRLYVGKARKEENIDDFYISYISIET